MNPFLTLAGVHLISAMSPGPDFFVVAKTSVRSGRKNGAMVVLGIMTSNVIFTGLVLGGLSLLIQKYPLTLTVIKYLGAVFLCYLAFKCIQSEGMSGSVSARQGKPESFKESYLNGLMTSILNPKAILYFTSVLSQFIQPDLPGLQRAMYGVVLVIIAALWFFSVNFLVSWRPFRTRYLAASKWIDRGMGVVLFVFAVGMLLQR